MPRTPRHLQSYKVALPSWPARLSVTENGFPMPRADLSGQDETKNLKLACAPCPMTRKSNCSTKQPGSRLVFPLYFFLTLRDFFHLAGLGLTFLSFLADSQPPPLGSLLINRRSPAIPPQSAKSTGPISNSSYPEGIGRRAAATNLKKTSTPVQKPRCALP